MFTSTLTPGNPRTPLLPALLLLAGLGALYLPSFNDLFHGPWSTDRNAHGPIVMVVAFAYMYFRIRQLLADGLFVRAPAPLAGAILLGLGLVSYALGRSQNVLMLEVGSLILVLSGLLVFNYGVRTWSRLWFAFFFMLFMIPLPASIVDVLTLPMKIGASAATEHLLYWAGYPIARSGVILTIGQYQLLVADACAGLNSLFTLEALGLLYMNLVRHPSVTRNVVLALLIVPISFSANTIRIVFLSLITYHFGDAAGQGFMHGFSGLVLFLSALMLIIFVDSALNWLVRRQRAVREADPSERGLQLPKLAPGAWSGMTDLAMRPAASMFVALLITAGAAYALTPRLETVRSTEKLAISVPESFGNWRAVETPHMQAELATTDEGGALQDQIYDDVLMRTYVNSKGEQVMLAIAYAREQRQDVKLHLPEVCYPAQGYKVLTMSPADLQVAPGGAPVPGKHMIASGNNRLEAVTYWTRVSDAYPNKGLAMRMKIFKDGLHGKIADGILVRSSMLIHTEAEAAASYAVQQDFLRQLVTATGTRGKALVVAAASVRP
ncbi:MAG: exosortase B [Duganella sp.]